MPYKWETQHVPMPRKYDGRVKLTTEQREAIRLNKLGLSAHALAKEYKVSRRLIQCILDPAKAEAIKAATKRRVERAGGWSVYHAPHDMTAAVKRWRRKKQLLKLAGSLKGETEK